jgi:uncharacterized protein (DUF2236 family)
MARDVDPVEGFFGPGSAAWQINRESVLYFGGMRALLMQLAHPQVAQGVAEHSSFAQDPFGRALRTFSTISRIVYGDRDAALRAAARMHAIHGGVRGENYAATDPELLFWVLATLIDSTRFAYELYLHALPRKRWQQFYEDCRLAARLFGISDLSIMPPTFAAFERRFEELVASETITVSATARRLANRLIAQGPLNSRITRPLLYVLAAGTLPAKLRNEYRFSWNLPVRAAFSAGTLAVWLAAHSVPRPLRSTPAALRAELRCWLGGKRPG